MARYTCLKQQTFSIGDYSLVPLRYEDRFLIMKWRNEQIYHLRQAHPLTEDDQQRYFDNVVAKLYDNPKPDQILFSYLEKGECIGYGGLVHINWNDLNAEISFIMDTILEAEHFSEHWGNYLTMLKQVAFNDLYLHKIYTFAFDLRPHLYPIFEEAGLVREATLKEHCLYNGEYKDVVIHSIWNKRNLTSHFDK
ncbi:MAG: GNAT family N-acetyltransferase [Bacteroidales bacterium]|nr:GNAT family N-acetyltransferase [Bacteroidales bacterium]